MMKIYVCLVGQHDLRLVAVAATILVLSALTAVGLLAHAKKSSTAGMRRLWSAVAALSCGCGVWATHFIAILAYQSPVPVAYSAGLTVCSLALAIGSFEGAFTLALSNASPHRARAGGVMLGLGLAAMHYTGVFGLSISELMTWDGVPVAWSVVVAVGLCALALPRAIKDSVSQQSMGALLIVAATLGLHFIGMGGATVAPGPAAALPGKAFSPELLAVMVASVSLAVLVFACAGLTLDWRERSRAAREADRMRGLADAAVEGLLVCQGTTIVTANVSFAKLSGLDVTRIDGEPLSKFLPDADVVARIMKTPNVPFETVLRSRDGGSIAVEIILREIDFAGRRHCAIAVRDLRDRKRAEQRIRFLAHFDALTGLPNRASFNDALDEQIAGGAGFAVFCLDLDRFKEVNDLFGHLAGDEMLQSVAMKVPEVLTDGSVMARLGGDEFAILMPGVSEEGAARRVAELVLARLKAEATDGSPAPMVSSSIGIALFPNDGTDRQSLLNHADTALYGAKSAGRGTYRFFDAEMGAKVHDRRLIEHELRVSLANREMTVVYQPQSQIDTGAIVGFEALVRWKHPERGDVSPAVFIPIAEESGSILQIGNWVMRTACAEAASWSAPLRIAVNVSAIELHSPNYADTVRDILVETGLSPSRLEIEITETAIIRDFNRALGTLRQLKALGIRIAMDDFGTGYSSLSNLRAFPFDKIKIDGSFVHEVHRSEDSAAIVRAVLGLGRGLNLPILAEGVETMEELAFLDREFCQEAQGYYVGRPLPIASFHSAVHPEASAPAMVAAPPEIPDRAAA